jgi:DNA-binding LytR/AlgR family response regulator
MNDDLKLDEIIKRQDEILKRLYAMDKPVFVQDGEKKRVLRVSEICFVTTNPKGLDIFTTDGKKHINFDSISEMDKEYQNTSLMKTHKSFIINLDLIDSVKVVPGGREVTFKGISSELTARITFDTLDEFHRRFGKT